MQRQILHVTECLDGGVATVIGAIVAGTPDYNHFLLYEGNTRPESIARFEESRRMPQGFVGRIKSIEEILSSAAPDILHAHSSWAGIYSRLVPSRLPPTVYQPHGFAYTNMALPRHIRWTARIAEYVLASRTTELIAVSDWERSQAPPTIRDRAKVIVNATKCSSSEPNEQGNLRVVTVGRISPQKDPEFFGRLASSVRQLRPDIEFRWIGDGDEKLKKELSRNGVAVTGWLTESDLELELLDAGLYFHSATMEAGIPLSILEAAAYGKAIIARNIPAIANSTLCRVDSVSNATEVVLTAIDCPEYYNELRSRSILLHTQYGFSTFSDSWTQLYRSLLRN